MRYYPVSLDIAGKNCLVVGGGAVGTRKVKTLLKCGAIVCVISMDFTKSLNDLANTTDLTLLDRPYCESDLKEKFLVISATDDKILNKKISDDACRQQVLCNIADRPDASDFILPAVVHRGDLTIAISTSGKSPAFSKKLRKDLEEQFGEEYSQFLELMGAARKKLLQTGHAPDTHKQLFKSLIKEGLLELIQKKDIINIDMLLLETFGNGFSYKDLMEE